MLEACFAHAAGGKNRQQAAVRVAQLDRNLSEFPPAAEEKGGLQGQVVFGCLFFRCQALCFVKRYFSKVSIAGTNSPRAAKMNCSYWESGMFSRLPDFRPVQATAGLRCAQSGGWSLAYNRKLSQPFPGKAKPVTSRPYPITKRFLRCNGRDLKFLNRRS